MAAVTTLPLSGVECSIWTSSSREAGGPSSKPPVQPPEVNHHDSQTGAKMRLPGDAKANVSVIVVGFLGATWRQLRRYAEAWGEILSRQHFASRLLVVRPPVSFVFNAGCTSDPSLTGYGALAVDLKQSLMPGESCVLHLLSNGGAFLYEALVSETSSSESSEFWGRSLRGVVFDSSPVDITPSAIRIASQQSLGEVGSAVAWLALQAFAGQDLATRRRMFATAFTVPNALSNVPRLFLFSKSDKIASSAFIQSLLSRCQGASSYDFHVTGHVQHQLTFPKVYHDQLEQFLDSLFAPVPRSRL